LTDIVAFEVAGQRYGLPTEIVREIVRAVSIHPLPRAPAIIEGVIDVRGTVVPVLDLRSRFRLPPRPVHPNDYLIVARAGPRTVALRADRASGPLSLDPIEVSDPKDASPKAELVSGIARHRDGIIFIHDLHAFLTEAEAETLDLSLSGGKS